MLPPPVTVGALAFVGPAHAAQLPAFCYIRVREIKEDLCVVQPVGPDQDDQEVFEVPTKKVQLRLVREREAGAWPGSYVAKTVAFVSPHGPAAGNWAYGVVSGYRMPGEVPTLEIIHGEETVAVAIDDATRVIVVDHLNYALQLVAGTNATVLNAFELLESQNEICTISSKKRGKTLAAVQSMLSVPFVPGDLVPLLRPATLKLVRVRRQHILDVTTQSSKRRAGSVYDDPELTAPAPRASSDQGSTPPPATGRDECIGSAPSNASNDSDASDDSDVEAIRRQNTSLGKRRRSNPSRSSSSDDSASDADDVPATTKKTKTAFRPSATTCTAHRRVVKPEHRGKEPQKLLELIPHLPHVAVFLATPAVLRSLYEFGFDRGLELMHCQPLKTAAKRAAKEKIANMSDFSERHGLRKVPAPRGKHDVVDCLRGLRMFGRYFYNDPTNKIIDAAAVFVDGYSGVDDDDAGSWNNVASWIAEKFGTYRSFLVCGDALAAAAVASQFHRYDDSLADWHDIRQVQRSDNRSAQRRPGANGESTRRTDRQQRKSTIPQSVRDNLPKSNGKSLCMKYLSVEGCSGDNKGGCFDPRRAHFRPKPSDPRDDARAIINRFGGLDDQFADL